MKTAFILIFFSFLSVKILAQKTTKPSDEKAIIALVDQYSLAREKQDTVLLKSILTTDIDQLVSNGDWRYGLAEATKGMVRSSTTNSGKRMLIVEKVKFLSKNTAVADARYEIQNADGTPRKMWSAFILVKEKGIWKISAIRNMLPAKS